MADDEPPVGLIDQRHAWHLRIRELFLRWFLGGPGPDQKTPLDADELLELRRAKQKFYKTQWAFAPGVNFGEGNCPRGCRYCYAVAFSHRRTGAPIPDIEDDRNLFVANGRSINRLMGHTSRKQPELRIFASMHDVFPENLGDYLRIARHLVTVANVELLIVTKAGPDVVRPLCAGLANVRDKVMIVITITSADDETLKFWEPHAPTFAERLESLEIAHANGFRTSVSLEPFLSDPRPVIAAARDFVTHGMWLGSMEHTSTLEFSSNEEPGFADRHAAVNASYTRENVTRLVEEYENDPKVFFKFTLMQICGLTGTKS